MNHLKKVTKRKEELASKLLQVNMPNRKQSEILWEVGSKLGVTGTTVKNYLIGNIADGYLGEEILDIFKEKGLYICD